jgi:CubicO group peptidase (beta-lactamase class C family)
VRELLDFTSGLDPAFTLHSDRVPDRNAAALRAPVVAAPGRAFTYGPSHGQALCEVMRRKLAARGATPAGFLRQRVLDPLGIGPVAFREDRKGNPLWASGMQLTARQWSKYGEMLRLRGRSGWRVVVDEGWWEPALRGSRVNPAFGFGLWLNRAAARPGAAEVDIEQMLERPWQQQQWHGRCLCRDAPADLLAAVGSGYQRLFVIPSRGLVVVRQGSDARFSDAEFLRRLLRG